MSSAVRIVAARSGVRLGSAAVKTTGVTGLIAASRASAYSGHAGVAASCRVTQLAFKRGFLSTVGDNATASADATVTKKAAPKKAATKKAAPKKAAVKKPAKAAKKVTAKAKKPVKKAKKTKAKAKPKKAKVLTEEQAERREATAQTKKIRALKKEALFTGGPKTLPVRSWIVYVSDDKQLADSSLAPISVETLGARMTELSRRYKALSADELEALRAKAAQNLKKNEEAYKEWVASHSPETIATANRARRALVRLAKEGKVPPLPPAKKRMIEDHRLPKRGLPAYALFTREKWASGQFASTTLNISEVTKILKEEWKALPDEERKKYMAQSADERAAHKEDLTAALEKLSL